MGQKCRHGLAGCLTRVQRRYQLTTLLEYDSILSLSCDCWQSLVLADCWLEKSVPCHVGLSIDGELPCQPASPRLVTKQEPERAGRKQSLYRLTSEVASHHSLFVRRASQEVQPAHEGMGLHEGMNLTVLTCLWKTCTKLQGLSLRAFGQFS